MAHASRLRAAELGIPIVFSAVDKHGNLVYLEREEDSLLASIDIARKKLIRRQRLRRPPTSLRSFQRRRRTVRSALYERRRVRNFRRRLSDRHKRRDHRRDWCIGGDGEEDMRLLLPVLRYWTGYEEKNMTIDTQGLEAIIKKVMDTIDFAEETGRPLTDGKDGIFEDIDDAIAAAAKAQKEYA